MSEESLHGTSTSKPDFAAWVLKPCISMQPQAIFTAAIRAKISRKKDIQCYQDGTLVTIIKTSKNHLKYLTLLMLLFLPKAARIQPKITLPKQTLAIGHYYIPKSMFQRL